MNEIFDVKETVRAVRGLQMAYLEWEHAARDHREFRENFGELKETDALLSKLNGTTSTVDFDDLYFQQRDRVAILEWEIVCRLGGYERSGLFQQILNSLENDFDPDDQLGSDHD